jgi:hypothetical protein
MVPETLIAMLATARLGAIHSMVFGGFAANELATRIDDAKPKVVVSAWAARMTLSTWQVTVSPPARWRKFSPRIRMSPNVPWSAPSTS